MAENEGKTPDEDQIAFKQQRRAQAMQQTEEMVRDGRVLEDQDIEVVNITARLARSRLMEKALARGIWFDEDFNPPDPGSDRDPDDPYHGHAPVPIDVDDPWV